MSMKKNLFEISQEEKDRILNLHENHTKEQYLNLVTERLQFDKNVQKIQKALRKLGFKGVGSADGVYGRKTACAVYEFQKKNGLNPGTLSKGKVDDATAKKLSELTQMNIDKYNLSNVDVSTACQTSSKTIDKTKGTQNCTSILPETCSKISPSKETTIGNGGKEGCSEYVRKSIGETLGDAWKAFNVAKKYGVKYNMFTDGSIDWNNVRNQMKTNKINSSTCGCFTQEGESKDKSCSSGSQIAKTISSFYPSSSNVNINSLKVGDIVGMYYRDSGNKGKAFCERSVQRGLDGNGNVRDTDPFTFNTHVGYVGAIKDGMPMIYHSVHGTRLSTPASQLKSKNGSAMIAWVTGGPKSAETSTQQQTGDKSWFEKFKDLF